MSVEDMACPVYPTADLDVILAFIKAFSREREKHWWNMHEPNFKIIILFPQSISALVLPEEIAQLFGEKKVQAENAYADRHEFSSRY